MDRFMNRGLVEPIEMHHLSPGGHEVRNKLFLASSAAYTSAIAQSCEWDPNKMTCPP